MTIEVIGSGSTGNCYIITSAKQKIILELGCNFHNVLEKLNFNLSDIVGCIVSHVHSDHTKYVNKAREYQLDIWGNSEVKEKYSYVNLITTKYRYSIGDFKIQCIKVPHNALCYAFIIDCPTHERILFCTDLSSFHYTIKDIDVIMIEANYSNDILINKMAGGAIIRSQSNNHMEINDTIETIIHNISSKTKSIILLHLSNALSNTEEFCTDVQNAVVHLGKKTNVYVATANDVYAINESDF